MRANTAAAAALIALSVVACAEADGGGSAPTTIVPSPTTTIPDSPTTIVPDGPDAPLPDGIEGPVFIDSTEILYFESFPVQVRLVVRGSLPTPCHQVQWSVEDLGSSLSVKLWSTILLGQDCAQVLEPFEELIPLGSYESASLPVVLNGELIGRISIGAEPATGGLVGAGWSFGMCGGFCWADLVADDSLLVLTGGGWASEEPLFVNRGTLTGEGLGRIAGAVNRLGDAVLDEVYGCPDCADGGASYVVLNRAGMVSRHDMEFGRPPEILAELQRLALAIIDALETCQSDELVVVADDCRAWEGF